MFIYVCINIHARWYIFYVCTHVYRRRECTWRCEMCALEYVNICVCEMCALLLWMHVCAKCVPLRMWIFVCAKCVPLHMWVHVHINMYIRMYIFHMCAHVYRRRAWLGGCKMCALTYVNICVYQHVCTCVTCSHIHSCVLNTKVDTWIQNVCSHVCRYMHASTRVYVYTFSIYIHICIYYESGYVD